MAALVLTGDRGPRLTAGLTAVGALLLGVIAAALAAATHPVVLVGLPLVAWLFVAALDRPVLGLLFTIGAMPVALVDLSVPGVPLEVIEVGVVASAATVAVASVLAGRAPLGWSPPMWALLALLGIVILSAATGLDRASAVTQTLLLTGGILLVSSVQAACANVRDVRWVASWLLAMGAVLSVYTASQLGSFNVYHGGAVVEGRVTGVFSQANELGAFTAMLVLLGIGVTLAARSPAGRLIGAGATLANTAALALSLSRGAWVGALFGLVAYVVLLPNAARLVVRVGLPALVAAAAIAVPVLRSPPQTVEVIATRATSVFEGAQNPYDERPQMWAEALRLTMERPLVGHGPASFPEASTSTPDATLLSRWSHAHNTLLTLGSELGLLAVATLVAFSAWVAVVIAGAAHRMRSVADQHLVAALGAAVATQVGHGVVDFHLRNPLVLFTALLLTGLALAMTRGEEAP